MDRLTGTWAFHQGYTTEDNVSPLSTLNAYESSRRGGASLPPQQGAAGSDLNGEEWGHWQEQIWDRASFCCWEGADTAVCILDLLCLNGFLIRSTLGLVK